MKRNLIWLAIVVLVVGAVVSLNLREAETLTVKEIIAAYEAVLSKLDELHFISTETELEKYDKATNVAAVNLPFYEASENKEDIEDIVKHCKNNNLPVFFYTEEEGSDYSLVRKYFWGDNEFPGGSTVFLQVGDETWTVNSNSFDTTEQLVRIKVRRICAILKEEVQREVEWLREEGLSNDQGGD